MVISGRESAEDRLNRDTVTASDRKDVQTIFIFIATDEFIGFTIKSKYELQINFVHQEMNVQLRLAKDDPNL